MQFRRDGSCAGRSEEQAGLLAPSLKKLHGAFVALRCGQRRERSQVASFAAARLAFARIKAIPAGFQLFDHFPVLHGSSALKMGTVSAPEWVDACATLYLLAHQLL